jgi:excisionase family DNA binding protein
MFYDEKVIAEVAARIASRIIPQIREANTGRIYPRLLSVAQAAELLGRSQNSMRHLIDRHEIPVVRHGRSVRLDIADLEKWLERDKV